MPLVWRPSPFQRSKLPCCGCPEGASYWHRGSGSLMLPTIMWVWKDPSPEQTQMGPLDCSLWRRTWLSYGLTPGPQTPPQDNICANDFQVSGGRELWEDRGAVKGRRGFPRGWHCSISWPAGYAELASYSVNYSVGRKAGTDRSWLVLSPRHVGPWERSKGGPGSLRKRPRNI